MKLKVKLLIASFPWLSILETEVGGKNIAQSNMLWILFALSVECVIRAKHPSPTKTNSFYMFLASCHLFRQFRYFF